MYSLRPVTPEDHECLRIVHHAAFFETVSLIWGWDDDLQDRMFNEYFAAVPLQVIEVDGSVAGFLDVQYQSDHIFVTNIALDPSAQGRGIGTRILQTLIEEASTKNLPLRLEVMKVNLRARRLYECLGFAVNGESETHFKMEYAGLSSEPESPNI